MLIGGFAVFLNNMPFISSFYFSDVVGSSSSDFKFFLLELIGVLLLPTILYEYLRKSKQIKLKYKKRQMNLKYLLIFLTISFVLFLGGVVIGIFYYSEGTYFEFVDEYQNPVMGSVLINGDYVGDVSEGGWMFVKDYPLGNLTLKYIDNFGKEYYVTWELTEDDKQYDSLTFSIKTG